MKFEDLVTALHVLDEYSGDDVFQRYAAGAEHDLIFLTNKPTPDELPLVELKVDEDDDDEPLVHLARAPSVFWDSEHEHWMMHV